MQNRNREEIELGIAKFLYGQVEAQLCQLAQMFGCGGISVRASLCVRVCARAYAILRVCVATRAYVY